MVDKKPASDAEVIENLELLTNLDMLQGADDWDYLLSDLDMEITTELQSEEKKKEGDK